MVFSLVRGQKIDLTKNDPNIKSINIGLNWNSFGNFDIDVSAFMVGQDEKIVQEEDFVFFGQPSSSNGAVTLEKSDKSNEKQHFIIDLLKVPDEVDKIAITLSIYESELNGHTFEEVSSLALRIVENNSQQELATFLINDEFSKVSAIILGSVYRYAGEWKFQAIGAGFFGGLTALCHEYGVEIDDRPQEESENHVQLSPGEGSLDQVVQPFTESYSEHDGGGVAAIPIETIQTNPILTNLSMKNYIEIPGMVKDVKEIHSENLEKLFENSTIVDDKISLDSLRETYRSDRACFIRLVDELSLRGFRFVTEKPTNILPNNAPQISSFLQVKEEGTRFRHFKLSSLGMDGFIQRFQVNNDLFFNKIPLHGFKFLNGNIDLSKVEEEFLNAGFLITKEGDSHDRLSEQEVEKEDKTSNNLEFPVDHSEELMSAVTINQLFEDTKYNLFRNYCKTKNITFISEISPRVLEKFSLAPGVGHGKVRAVEDRLEELKRSGVEILLDETLELDQEDPVILLKNKYAGDMEITQLFYENGFNKFRLFCEEKGVQTVGQIKRKHIEWFSSSTGIGGKKVREVLERLENYTKKVEDRTDSTFETGELFDSINHWKVSELLHFFGYQTISNNALRIEEIQGQQFEELEREFDVRTLMKFSTKIKKLKHPKTIADGIREILNDQQRAVVDYRFNEKWTLEETAKPLGVTRERIRQIEAKALKKMKQYLEINDFIMIVKLLTNTNTLITRKELFELIGEENSFLIEVFKEKNILFVYFDKLDVFCLNPEECSDFNVIEEFISELPDQFFLHEYDQLFEEILEKLGVREPTIEMFHQVLEGYGLNHYGELYSKSKLRLSEILELLFKNFIEKPLLIDEPGLEYLQRLALDHFDYHLEGTLRSIDARLRDANNILLVDSNTFQWFDAEEFDQNVVAKVDQYLKDRFKEVNVVNIEEVFKAFEQQLEPLLITNKLHLYSLIKYFLEDEYSIGKGNTLNIYQNDEDKMDRKETIVEAIRNMGGTCSKVDLQEILRVPMYRIDQAISSSDKLIPWGTNQIKLFEDIGLTSEEKEGLRVLAEKTMKDGYTTIGIIYNELMFNRNLAGLIAIKGIDSKAKLAAVIKNLNPELKGHTNFMYKEGSPYTSFDDVIVSHFSDGATRKDIQDFAIEHGYSDVMASNLVGSLLDQELVIEIDYDLLFPAKDFHIPTEVISELRSYIEQQMGQKEYISLSNLKGYKRNLPIIEFRWNPYLIRTILVKNGFKQISKIYRDYRYDKVLVVREKSKINTFEELVYSVLKEEYEGNMHEVKVYDFLVAKGILREQEYDQDKVLPHEIRDSNSLISVNTIGIVSLGQGI